jgi:uncharacterized protein (TIGR02453 family)
VVADTGFSGFPKQCTRFLAALKRNNDKFWFERHRSDYDQYVVAPARAFVTALGRRLRKRAPGVNADPRIDKSIFRIHRDTRFSPDKSPYKSHLGIWLWEGGGPRMACSGFYFHLEPRKLGLGTGIYLFPQEYLTPYRESVVDAKHGRALRRALTLCSRLPGCVIGGQRYKRTPRGFDSAHPNAAYLLHGGLYGFIETRLPREVHGPEIVEYSYERFRGMLPLHRWLLAMTERAAK